eukprot:jgi/Tetstr1/447640/TSEL_034999.t1
MPSYELVSLPDGVPECLCGSADGSSGGGGRSSFSFWGKKSASRSAAAAAASRGFDPGRALKGVGLSAAEAETTSACRTRGDGLFEGGKAMRQNGNKMVMAPSAFSEENMMKTMAEMEEFERKQAEARAARRRPPVPAANPVPKVMDEQNLSSLDPSEGIFDLIQMADGGLGSMAGPTSAERVDRDPLFDISEDSGGAGVAAARKGAPGGAEGDFAFCLSAEEPVHKVTRRAANAKHPSPFLQVDIELPKLESASEASVKTGKRELALAAGNTYRLKIKLPCAVKDAETSAKWSKAKHKLTVILPVDSD